MGHTLLDENPLLVFPRLAKDIGLNEAIALQQIHYWVTRSRHTRNDSGHRWAPGTWEWWKTQFPFWSVSTIRRAFKNLEDSKLILVKQTARFNWVAVDHDALALVGEPDRDVKLNTLDERVSKMNSQGVQDEHPIGETEREKERKDASHPKEGNSRPNLTQIVWQHYRKVMGVKREQIDEAERRIINNALALFQHDASILCRAIDGCYASDFHMGRDRERNANGTKYNKLSQILKGKRGGKTDREQIEMFLEYAETSTTNSGFPSADDVTLRRRMQEAVAGRTNGDPTIVETGLQAERWLEKHGYKTVVTPSGDDRAPGVRFERIERSA